MLAFLNLHRQTRYKLFTALSLMAVIISYFMQYSMDYSPCLLCLLQRYVLIFLTMMMASLSCLNRPSPYKLGVQIVGFFTALAGVTVAARQVFLQYTLDGSQMQCIPNLHFMLEQFGLLETLKSISFACAAIDVKILGLTVGVWSLLYFVLVTVYVFLLPAKK